MLKHFRNQRKTGRVLVVSQLMLAVVGGLIGSIAGTREQGLAFALGASTALSFAPYSMMNIDLHRISLGALIIALAQFAMSVLVFAGHVHSAPVWFGRFLFAVVLKWLAVMALMLLFMQYLAPAPIMALAGVLASLAAIQLFNYFDAKVKRGS